MSDEERVLLEWQLWLTAWLYATPSQRTELLVVKTLIESDTGWSWSPPYTLENPPRLRTA